MGRVCLVLALLFTCACGSGSDGEGMPNGAGPSCAEDEFKITGTLDGQAVTHSGTLQGHAWIQTGSNGTLDTPFEGGGSFHAGWQKLVADGETFAATGNVNLPVSGPHGGDTLDYGSGALTKLDNGVRFELSALSLNAQCVTTPCPSGAVAGTLQGCVEWMSF